VTNARDNQSTWTISAYQIVEHLYTGSDSQVYRARQKTDQRSVVLKMLRDEYPSPERIAWFRREYEIAHQAGELDGIPCVYGLEAEAQRWAIVFEDSGGYSLRHPGLAGTLSLPDFLRRAIDLADILARLHQRQIMHKDINPSNIVYDTSTAQIWLIDFGSAAILSRESPAFHTPHVLEGTPAYMSPEQTGRMNRAIDYRTDFYSLGVTLYELLTGHLPFSSNDALELVHSHIARHPLPPHEHTPGIPEPLSAIILKLMAKNAEDRYQSAYGLKTDLEHCLCQWEDTGWIAPFRPARHDISDHFQIPQKLYGREHESSTLLAAFERVSRGASELMLVTGEAGIGKSALVHEIYKPITHQRGYFISGKFDQFQRNIPYSALLHAFHDLVGLLLTEDEARIAAWRKKLLEAVGENGQFIIDVLPEVELIIGPQPALPPLGNAEIQSRFDQVFRQFIAVFAQPEHPLVLFLDDLQWADSASLRLIERLVTDQQCRFLFLIGSYRDDEVPAGHPLHMMADDLRLTGATVHHLRLNPLTIPDVTCLVVDTLQVAPDRARGLADLLVAKTSGNPFFLNEFFQSLYTESFITFDYSLSSWEWNIERIRAQGLTDNVIELLTNKVKRLSATTLDTLKLAACIGTYFDLETLAIVSEDSPTRIARALDTAIIEGLIIPLNPAYKVMTLEVEGLPDVLSVGYRFTHDRIQQAVYSFFREGEEQEIHWRVGWLLLQRVAGREQRDLEEHIFDIVNQLDYGIAFVATPAQRDELIHLNVLAAKKARAAAAYEPSLSYLRTALTLVHKSSSSYSLDMLQELYLEAIEAAYLNGNFKEMEEMAAAMLERPGTLLERARVYEIHILSLVAQNRQLEAVHLALNVLRMLKTRLPTKPDTRHIVLDLLKVRLALGSRQIEDLYDLPEMVQPRALAATRIIASVATAIYVASPNLLAPIASRLITLSMNYGNTPISAFAYASYGVILCGVVGHINNGYRFGRLSLRLLERFATRELRSRTLTVVYNFIAHWKEHLHDTLEPLLEAHRVGMESGDLDYAALSAYMYANHLYMVGRPLEWVEQQMAGYSQTIARLNQQTTLRWNELYRQVVLNLLGRSTDPCLLVGNAYNEVTSYPLHLKTRDMTAIFLLFLNKLSLCYLFGNYAQAVEHAAQARRYLRSLPSSPQLPLFHFYDALARLALLPSVDQSERAALVRQVAANQRKLKKWAHHAPMNYLHKWHLVEAERLRLRGKDAAAMYHYDQAIALAQEHQYLNEEALALELAARFYLGRGQPRAGSFYMRDAHYAYLRWGAHAKVADLEACHPYLVRSERDQDGYLYSGDGHTGVVLRHSSSSPSHLLVSTSSGRRVAQLLDMATVIKASQAISDNITLETLLPRLMRIVIEHAGAQRGLLILKRSEHLLIEAEGTIDHQDLYAEPRTLNNDLCPLSVVHYVGRTHEPVVLDDATSKVGPFAHDPYLRNRRPRSVLCIPLTHHAHLVGMLYLENNAATGTFTADRLEVLSMLSSQVAISVENAVLYNSLRQKASELHAIIQGMADGLLVVSEQEHIVMVNQKAVALLGRSSADLINQPLEALSEVNDAVKAAGLQHIIEQVRNGLSRTTAHNSEQSQAEQIEEEHISLGEYIVRASSAPIPGQKGTLVGTVVLLQDVTRAVEADRAKNAFIATASHEMRTPLTSLKGFVDLFFLMDSDNLTENQRMFLGTIKEQTDRMVFLVNDLLEIARLEQGIFRAEHRWVAPGQAIQEALDSLSVSISEHSLSLHTDVVPNLPTLWIDAMHMRRILTNLLSNAIKYTPSGGDIYVRAYHLDDPARLPSSPGEQRWTSEDPYSVVIEIEDTGVGIRQEDQPRIFTRFFRSDNPLSVQAGGTGLGLAIARSLVHLYGGQIGFRSTENQGSCFWVRLVVHSAALHTNTKEMAS
jgi:predicted ATPase/signal transduction histidine kinase/tRNA A-37 threonylcarbamoyl transferase component Bud32